MAATRTAAKKVNRWSQHVTETSDAMDLKPDVFRQHDPKAIARSLQSSAEHSDRRKSDPYRSAMSMLTFYVNRAGHNLEPAQHAVLEHAKDELRALYGRPPAKRAAGSAAKKVASKKVAAKKTAARKVAAKTRAARKTASE